MYIGFVKTLERAENNHKPSSRTRVTGLPITPRYRFFSRTCIKMAHANFSHWNTLAPQVSTPLSHFSTLLPRLCVSSFCRHAFSPPPRPCGRLLLSLRRIQSSRRLRENVRVQKIRLPLVGHQLRQASPEHSASQFPRRPALFASPPHRTRPPLDAFTILPVSARLFTTAFSIHP